MATGTDGSGGPCHLATVTLLCSALHFGLTPAFRCCGTACNSVATHTSWSRTASATQLSLLPPRVLLAAPTLLLPYFFLLSTWFADAAWAALGLPDAWLHTMYQAVLAPVRFLWHTWPAYKAHYSLVEQHFGLASEVPGVGGLLLVMGSAGASFLRDMATQLLPSLAATAAVVAGLSKACASARGEFLTTVWEEASLLAHFAVRLMGVVCTCIGRCTPCRAFPPRRRWFFNRLRRFCRLMCARQQSVHRLHVCLTPAAACHPAGSDVLRSKSSRAAVRAVVPLTFVLVLCLTARTSAGRVEGAS